jgi:hypothetical protein
VSETVKRLTEEQLDAVLKAVKTNCGTHDYFALHDHVADLERRLKEAERDVKRLDWIEKHWFMFPSDTPDTVEFLFNESWYGKGKNLRAAIDTAMQDGK